jgi:hypothetical protein
VAYLVVCGFRGTIRVVSALFWLLVIYFVIDAAFFCCFEAPYFGRLLKMSDCAIHLMKVH